MNPCVEIVASEKVAAAPTAYSLQRWPGLSKQRATKDAPRTVHVHVDSFFASVEKILNPKLCGKAVLVGRDVVCSASDEAQLRGVRIGMSLRDALRVCPKAVVVAGAHDRYAEFSERVRQVLENFAATVEMSAPDDFDLDLADTKLPDSNFEATLKRLQWKFWSGPD